ncbi:MAG TPA: alpha/beta fold hydrolase [Euzebya sp.]|nr:alpha/beta fold hydrolase [Euzebya sp.]
MQLTVGGRRVFAHTGGAELRLDPNDGRVVVLVHGAGNDHSVWRHQTRRLAGLGQPVLAVDLPGHGRSAGPALTSVGAMADWVGGVLDGVGATSATVVGHSMGSLVAVESAARLNGRVDRIALVATAAQIGVHPTLQQAADDCDPLAIDLIVGWSHNAASRFGGHPQAGMWTRQLTRRLLERNLAVLGIDLSTCTAYDAAAAAGSWSGDALVIAGAADRMTPAGAGRAMADLLGTEAVLVDGGSHVSLYDHPGPVNAALVPWVCAAA